MMPDVLDAAQRDGALPERFLAVAGAPHRALFPRCAVVVHHGGSGTTAAALRAGVPQVILPMLLDQFHHAHHLVRAGPGPRAPELGKVTAAALTKAIDEALAWPEAPRRAIAARLEANDAGNTITDQLEALVRVGRAHSARQLCSSERPRSTGACCASVEGWSTTVTCR